MESSRQLWMDLDFVDKICFQAQISYGQQRFVENDRMWKCWSIDKAPCVIELSHPAQHGSWRLLKRRGPNTWIGGKCWCWRWQENENKSKYAKSRYSFSIKISRYLWWKYAKTRCRLNYLNVMKRIEKKIEHIYKYMCIRILKTGM